MNTEREKVDILGCRAMVISVGGTPQPLIKTIQEYKPEFVSFFSSQETCRHALLVREDADKQGVPIKSELTLADDANDLLHCYEKANEAVNRVLSKGYRREEIIIDYTGGTKNMSVALTLASIVHGFSFSYVGGMERTKDGVGIVVDGKEKIYSSVNPWDFLAVEEKRNIALLFNQYQFKAARDLAEGVSQKTKKYKALYKKVAFLIEGYHKWDLFRHQEALELFRRAKVEEIAEFGDFSFRNFSRKTAANLDLLENLAKSGKKPTMLHILDMYANAERRSEEGKTDDAVLRLYRLVEMIAQERLSTKYCIEVSDVKKDRIPYSLKEDFEKNHKSQRDGKIKVSLTAAFKLLMELGDDTGRLFKENEARFLDIQSSRNYSYLAHGFEYSKEKTYTALRDFVLTLGIIDTKAAPVFPKIEVQ